MNHKHAALAIALTAVLSAPAFAQTAGASNAINANNSSNTSGNNVSIMPGANTNGSASSGANASVTVMPSTSVAVPSANLLPGGVMAPAGSTTVLGGPSGDVSGTQTVTTRYWVNVPADAQNNGNFRRWQQLR